jgi:hypothetical protein
VEKFKFVLLIGTLLLIQSCATPISQERITSADYGSAPSDNYEAIIKERVSKILIDPTSPIYEFNKPRKGYTRQSPTFHTQESFGWMVCGTVNSKNRFGGYVGRVPFFALFRGDTIVEFMTGEITDNKYGLNLLNSNIENVCNR